LVIPMTCQFNGEAFLDTLRVVLDEVLDPHRRRYLRKEEAASYLRVNVRTLQRLDIRVVATKPKRYDRVDLDRYMESCKRHQVIRAAHQLPTFNEAVAMNPGRARRRGPAVKTAEDELKEALALTGWVRQRRRK
jgi:hypothetical protein